MTTPTPDDRGAAGAERPEQESDAVAPGDAAGASGASGGPVAGVEAGTEGPDAARPAAGTPDRLVKRGPAAPKPAQGGAAAGATETEGVAAATPRPPAAAPAKALGAGAPADAPAATPQADGATDDAAPAAPAPPTAPPVAPPPPGTEAAAANDGGLALTKTPNSAPTAASLPPAPSAPPVAASLPAAPPAPPVPVATEPATPTTAPPAAPHNPWAAPSPAATRPNPWAAPAPAAAVPAAFGAPPQPGEQLPREPLSIAAIGAAGMLLSPVALGLSALALRRHRRRPARGRSLAVAAATIAVAQLGVAAVAVPVALSWDSGEETVVAAEQTTEVEPADDAKAPSKDDPEWQDWHDEPDPDLPTATGPLWADLLAPGDCIGALPEGDAILDLGLVSCNAPHEGEVFARVELFGQGEEAPDDEELMDLALQGCDPQIVPYVLDSWKVLTEDEPLEVAVMHPTAETWAQGDRQVTCYFVGPGGEPTTGTARGNPASYDADQRTLLRITAPRDSAMLSSPYLHDHERLTAWAETTGEAAENQAALLRNIYLDQYGATPAALRLARAREAEAEFWREVADSPDSDAFYAAMAEDETVEAAETAEAKLREKLDLPAS